MKRLKGRPVTKEIFTAIKDMIATGERTQKQVGMMWGYSENTIYIINRFDEYEEYKEYSNRKNNRKNLNETEQEQQQLEMDVEERDDALKKSYQMNRIYNELKKQNEVISEISTLLNKIYEIWSK